MDSQQSTIDLVLKILTLANTLAPVAADVIILVRRQNGTMSVIAALDEADAQFDRNLAQIAEWMRAHGK